MANDKREQAIPLGVDSEIIGDEQRVPCYKGWTEYRDREEAEGSVADLCDFRAGFLYGWEARHAAAEGIPQSDGWVDVADRLPDAKEGWNQSEQVLVWYQPSLDAVGNYGIAYYHYDPPYRPCEWVDFAHLGREPIAWMPIPPYQRPSREGE